MVVLNPSIDGLPGDIWQYLEMYWLPLLGEWGWGRSGGYWHLGVEAGHTAKHPIMQQDSPHNKELFGFTISIVLKFKSPDVENA